MADKPADLDLNKLDSDMDRLARTRTGANPPAARGDEMRPADTARPPDVRVDTSRQEGNRPDPVRQEQGPRTPPNRRWIPVSLYENWIKVVIGAIIVIAVVSIWIWSAGRSKVTPPPASASAESSVPVSTTTSSAPPLTRSEADIKDCLAVLANTPPGLNPESEKAKSACGAK